jgi:hypothetical protein
MIGIALKVLFTSPVCRLINIKLPLSASMSMTILYCTVLSVWVALVQNDLHLVEAKTDRDVGASGTKRGTVFEFADK